MYLRTSDISFITHYNKIVKNKLDVRSVGMVIIISHPDTQTINFHPFDLTQRAMTSHEKSFQTMTMLRLLHAKIIDVYFVEYVIYL